MMLLIQSVTVGILSVFWYSVGNSRYTVGILRTYACHHNVNKPKLACKATIACLTSSQRHAAHTIMQLQMD